MKLVNKALFILAAALTLASCVKTEEYVPAQKEEGTRYYFAVDTPSDYAITSSETVKVEIPVYRTSSEEAAQIIVSVKDTSGLFFAEKNTELNLSFAAQKAEANLSVPIKFTDLSADFGHKYGVVFTIKDESKTTEYALSEFKAEIYAPEPWKSLGYGVWQDAWLFEDEFEKVQFFQNELYPNQFRIGWGEAIAERYEDENAEDWPEFFPFSIVPVGTQLGSVTTTIPDLVYYDIFNSGMYVSSYSDFIYLVHPSKFSSLNDESVYAKNKVVSYQENGLPAVVELAPAYYMINYNAGWASQANTVNMTLVFPGVVIADYSITQEFQGVMTDPEGDEYALAQVELGADVAEAKAMVVAGTNPNAAIPTLLSEEENPAVVTFSEGGLVRVPMPEELSENYCLVFVTFSADGEGQEADYTAIAYRDYSVALSASEPVANADKVSGTVEAEVALGKDTEFVLVTVVPDGEKAQENALALLQSEAENDVPSTASVIKVKKDGKLTFNLPASGKYYIVAASVAEGEVWHAASKAVTLVTLPVLLNEDFEDISTLADWKIFDADNDGYSWVYDDETLEAHSGVGLIFSQSYRNGVGALTPDNWVFSASFEATDKTYLSFWVAAQDPSWNAEHYAVYVTDADLEDDEFALANVTDVLVENTFPAGTPAEVEQWQEQLSNGSIVTYTYERFIAQIPDTYAGKTVRIAFRHYNCSDMYYLNLDDVMVTDGDPTPDAPSGAPAVRTLWGGYRYGASREAYQAVRGDKAVSVARGHFYAKAGYKGASKFANPE